MNLRIVKRDPSPSDPTRVLFLLPSPGEATAEDLAMLQALYSRDPRPIDDAVKMLKTTSSGAFMDKFYKGYGHDSVAELGNVTIAIENVPMPVAKLLQHYPLYRGQECSTRYIDFSKQTFVAATAEETAYQEELRSFYVKSLPVVTESVLARNNLDKTVPGDLRTAKAAAFDILRGFLPAGATTNVAWTTDLRNLNERINDLRLYEGDFPLLQNVLDKLRSLMEEVYPTSSRVRPATTDNGIFHDDFPFIVNRVSLTKLRSTPVGKTPNHRSYVELEATLDYASWRDIARHRSITQTFPRLTTKYGFEDWYINNLPDSLQNEARTLVDSAKNFTGPYTVPMGYKVAFYAGGMADKWSYVIKTRTAQTVHPTLRHLMHYMLDSKPKLFGSLECDRNPDWLISTKRGSQTIMKKES